jgi:hypothetical protein
MPRPLQTTWKRVELEKAIRKTDCVHNDLDRPNHNLGHFGGVTQAGAQLTYVIG